jgi:hypothetical protein
MRAVSFLIAQYELPPEERKFLVVRDDSSEKIEMWIAAIEHAFSPRMAAAVPFATRMDKFGTVNRYAVNQMGVYQSQINFQDKNQKFRRHAMIVGVDERDRANLASARPLTNSPFVLLDGKEKKAMFDADTSNRYFRFITGFNDAHQTFCREFLQMIDMSAPSAELFGLLDIYLAFENPALPNAESMARISATLGKYKLFNSGRLQKLYIRVNAELPRFLREDLRDSLRIVEWLQAVSRTVNDADAAGRLSDIVYTAFAEGLEKCYSHRDKDSARKILETLSRDRRADMRDMLFSIAGNAEKDYAAFIMEFIIEYDESIVATDASMMSFLKKLDTERMEHLYGAVIKLRIRLLTKPVDIGQFIKLIKKIPSLSDRDLTEIFEALDGRLVITEKGGAVAAMTIQQERPKGAVCVNSAHLYALEVLNDKRGRAQLTHTYNELIFQKFPSITSPDYIRSLTEKLFKAQLTQEELRYIIELFAHARAYAEELVNFILNITTPKRNDEWNALMAIAAKTRNNVIYDALIEECAKLKQGEKALAQLNDMLESKETQNYFRYVTEKAKEIIRLQKQPSGFGRFFGGKK